MHEVTILVRALLAEMKDLTVLSGVPEQTVMDLNLYMEQVADSEIRGLHNWLSDIREKEYENVRRVWVRHTPEAWNMYQLMEVFNLPEQIILKRQQRELVKTWKKAPKPKQNKSVEGSTEMPVRSEGSGTDEGNR